MNLELLQRVLGNRAGMGSTMPVPVPGTFPSSAPDGSMPSTVAAGAPSPGAASPPPQSAAMGPNMPRLEDPMNPDALQRHLLIQRIAGEDPSMPQGLTVPKPYAPPVAGAFRRRE